MKKKINLFEPKIDQEEINNVIKVLKSGFWASGAGTGNVGKFETKFTNYVKCKNSLAVNSGTSALHLALSIANIKEKEVILPSLSFVSTANAILYNGGKPIFVDVEPDTLCINISEVEKKISKQTAAIIPVHFGGFPCDLHRLKNITKKLDIKIIEDAAHAAGSKYKNKKIGSHGDLVCFSFHPVKNLAMPTGGLITFNEKYSKNQKKILMAKRWCGISNRKGSKYDIKEIGWNFYMNEISASIGLIQLKKLDTLNYKRKKTAEKYHSKINLKTKMPLDENCSYHFYWILVKNRDFLRRKLMDYGIETGTHYKPIHQMSLYKGDYSLPVTNNISKKIITLPTHPNLSSKDIKLIVSIINEFAK